MQSPVPVIDADGHVMEPPEAWEHHLDEKLRDAAPHPVTDARGQLCWSIAGEVRPAVPAPEGGWESQPGGYDPKARLEDMDRQGIDRSILFPTTGLYFAAIRDARVQTALCRAYNDWLHEFCSADRRRLVGVAVVPQRDIGESVREARRAVTELGFRGVMLRPNPIAGRDLDDGAYTPLWEAVEELGVPIALHEGTTQDVVQSGRDRFENFLYRHACSHPHEQQIALMQLTCGGVLERHRGMRVALLESGCGWIAHWLDRLDEHVESWGHASTPVPVAPSQQFARQGFISLDPGERTLEGIVSVLGDGNVLFASDYPHPDALQDGLVECITGREGLTADNVRAILHDNAARCFGLRTEDEGQ
jgi:predicted TIM-barrel fold metal-dependent hydrolase